MGKVEEKPVKYKEMFYGCGVSPSILKSDKSNVCMRDRGQTGRSNPVLLSKTDIVLFRRPCCQCLFVEVNGDLEREDILKPSSP